MAVDLPGLITINRGGQADLDASYGGAIPVQPLQWTITPPHYAGTTITPDSILVPNPVHCQVTIGQREQAGNNAYQVTVRDNNGLGAMAVVSITII